jgi:GGDEF domain-containing protein
MSATSMPSEMTLVYYGTGLKSPPDLLVRFGDEHHLSVRVFHDAAEVRAVVNRAYPAGIVLDAAGGTEEVMELCAALKADAFTAIVPVVVLTPPERADLAPEGLAAGADEVIPDALSDREKWLRLEGVLRRAARDVSVHPTTRLPGTAQIERDLAERMLAGSRFAICYADLDHFKEFNDRYGYNHGDRVILLLSRILRDSVRGLAPGGFVGHIGGDDFIFTIPLPSVEVTCDEVIALFDELIPFQYTREDRQAGYFLGKDRRGSVYRVPLMTLSIGVVTNQFQRFSHTAQIAELAAEMKTYAKSLPGSLYVVDRRQTGIPGSRRTMSGEGEGDQDLTPVPGKRATDAPLV